MNAGVGTTLRAAIATLARTPGGAAVMSSVKGDYQRQRGHAGSIRRHPRNIDRVRIHGERTPELGGVGANALDAVVEIDDNGRPPADPFARMLDRFAGR